MAGAQAQRLDWFAIVHSDSLPGRDAVIRQGAAVQLPLGVDFASNLAANVAAQVTPASSHRHTSEAASQLLPAA